MKSKYWEIHIDKSRPRANKLCTDCGGTQHPGELALFKIIGVIDNGIYIITSENKLVSSLRVWVCEKCEDIIHRRVGR